MQIAKYSTQAIKAREAVRRNFEITLAKGVKRTTKVIEVMCNRRKQLEKAHGNSSLVAEGVYEDGSKANTLSKEVKV